MSGIYIPKMKKPEKCVLCDFASRGFCGQLNDFVKNMFLLDERCPLIEVPDHGRLIDADELFSKVHYDTPLSEVFEKTIKRYIVNCPTIIPTSETESEVDRDS